MKLLSILPVAVLLKVARGFSHYPSASYNAESRSQKRHGNQHGLLRFDTNLCSTPFSEEFIREKGSLQQEYAVPSPRIIQKVEKFARLPVWPAWNGVLIFVIQRIFGEVIAAKIEETIGGRVCPNFYAPEATSPFIMLVHHSHSFFGLDPLRYFQRTFFPEGFPAHPHRGFVTVTYILKGGFSHRDSLGIKQLYGAEERHAGKHTQWLTTGAGMLHEEMFDIQGLWSRQELYQIWLNLPASQKLCAPNVDLLGADECPVVEKDGCKTIVISGKFDGEKSAAPNLSEVSILHVKVATGANWKHLLPASHQTAILYVRQGSIQIGSTTILPHYTVYFEKQGNELSITSDVGADFMLLSGAPLNEPVSAQGSMVMNTPGEINQAYADYQMQKMGVPWDHKISDGQWNEHIQNFKSIYGVREK